jgi:hypothetical protein
MKTYGAGLVGLLVGTLLAGPVLAQDGKNVCLSRNRIMSWHAFDDSTIIYTDRQRNHYTVKLRDSCRGLTSSTATLIYGRSSGNALRCMSSGDAVSVKATGLAGATCRVASVQAGAPTQPAGTDQAPEHDVGDQPPG